MDNRCAPTAIDSGWRGFLSLSRPGRCCARGRATRIGSSRGAWERGALHLNLAAPSPLFVLPAAPEFVKIRGASPGVRGFVFCGPGLPPDARCSMYTLIAQLADPFTFASVSLAGVRSEERRVGKECRSR